MPIAIRSFAKINLGLRIGAERADGFHELRTIYQTLALHDVIRVEVQPGDGIEIRCNNPLVPLDGSNTCYKVAERVVRAIQAGIAEVPRGLKPSAEGDLGGTAKAVPLQGYNRESPDIGKIVIDIDKRLPVQGGMGGGSSNAAATMLGLERALQVKISAQDKMRIAAEVGSDVPLFLIGGTVLGVGRGEEVYPLQDLPTMHFVVVTPPVSVSTPKAFAQWEALVTREAALTDAEAAGTINEFGQAVYVWLSGSVFSRVVSASEPASGVPAVGGDRAETPLLDLVRAGIENDFERVVFPEYPDLREVKRVLEREGARYASLSGSGSTLYGLFGSGEEAHAAATRMSASGHAAIATTTLTREEYWRAVVRDS
ncbi:MAG: 4-(cytidine 5'-diphospho)-2-C-methyl-D-erythritol kinase [Candidatus Korobacteraceae bacterium]